MLKKRGTNYFDDRFAWIEYKYNVNCNDMYDEYSKGSSIKELGRKYNIHINLIKFMFKHKHLSMRTVNESIKLNNKKLKNVFLKKYGVVNPFQLDFVKEKMKRTSLEKYGYEYPSSSSAVRKKVENTNISKYGVKNQFQRKVVIEMSQKSRDKAVATWLRNYNNKTPEEKRELQRKREITMLKHFGVRNVFQLEEIKKKIKDKLEESSKKRKETLIKIGKIAPDCLFSEFELYRRRVRALTRRIKNKIFDSWDGTCYYTKDYIRDCKDRKNRPTIDHKISILYGFMNKIKEEDIADIKNICICKQSVNSSKNFRTETEYGNWSSNKKKTI